MAELFVHEYKIFFDENSSNLYFITWIFTDRKPSCPNTLLTLYEDLQENFQLLFQTSKTSYVLVYSILSNIKKLMFKKLFVPYDEISEFFCRKKKVNVNIGKGKGMY